MQLRRPSDKLAGVVWLARFTDKARAFLDGTIPPEYAAQFCGPEAMDGTFLRVFRLTKEAFVEAVRASAGNDESVAEWFRAQPSVSEAKIETWNASAPHFGRPGQPGRETLVWAREHVYPEVKGAESASAFEVMDLDEGRALG